MTDLGWRLPTSLHLSSAGRLCTRVDVKSTPDHICGLRSFRTLDNFEFDRVLFVQSLVSLVYDCRVMDKNIWTVIASDESESFRIIEPFDSALH